ncbi:hypothetical protein BCR32DRAFT_264277 [Anaeromyces robustus]|uniref:Uncharacterized protein n=1 Tax=Anaeromyces robustus TaxID=1754192 RepID=A0A1Y1XP39_9FUNG|nr:hypothetical protein BCR32DRAFT_264277 [Anaeromyces robustus]|eukprot:ORX87513.1 hypothetical protein BCR32DRAFT_264277 [Anaeromyces robustus]
MSNSEINEENLNDPAWKPLKSKRQIFEGSYGQFPPGSMSNLEGSRSNSLSNIKKFDIESGIVEQRKIAVIESKDSNIDISKKAEPNIEAYCASSEAKQLKQLLEHNSTSSPSTKKKILNKKELPVPPKKNIAPPPKPLNKLSDNDNEIEYTSENVNKLFNNMFQEIESAIEPESPISDDIFKTKLTPKNKPLPEKPNSASSSPKLPLKKKIPPPAVPSKPTTPIVDNSSPKTSKPGTPTMSNSPKISKLPPPPPVREKPGKSSKPQTPVKDTPPPPPPKQSRDEQLLSTQLPPQVPVKKTTPAPPTPKKTPIKKTLPPPPLPVSVPTDQQINDESSSPTSATTNENNEILSPTSANHTRTSIIALQKKALMLKNKKSLPPPPPPVLNDNNDNTNQLSRSLSLNDGSKRTYNKDFSPSVPCTPTTNIPSFLQLPTGSPKVQPTNVPNLCDLAIREDQEVITNSNNSDNLPVNGTGVGGGGLPRRSHSYRNHAVSMYSSSSNSSLPAPSFHSRTRSITYSHGKGESESEKLPDSFRSFFNEQEINENDISFIEENKNNPEEKKEKKDNDSSVEKTNARGFLFNQDIKKQRHQSKRISTTDVPDSMKLLFGVFGNEQELDSDSDNDNNDSDGEEEILTHNKNNNSNDVSSTIIPENSCEIYLNESYTPKLYVSSNKDKNCRNSSIINASIVPPNEPPIPSLDKKPFRGNTLRWVINVNC